MRSPKQEIEGHNTQRVAARAFQSLPYGYTKGCPVGVIRCLVFDCCPGMSPASFPSLPRVVAAHAGRPEAGSARARRPASGRGNRQAPDGCTPNATKRTLRKQQHPVPFIGQRRRAKYAPPQSFWCHSEDATPPESAQSQTSLQVGGCCLILDVIPSFGGPYCTTARRVSDPLSAAHHSGSSAQSSTSMMMESPSPSTEVPLARCGLGELLLDLGCAGMVALGRCTTSPPRTVGLPGVFRHRPPQL